MTDYVIDGNKLISYKGEAEKLVITGVGSVGSCAFKGNTKTKSITVSGEVKEINEKAFECCYGLEELVLCYGVTILGKGSFNNCPHLKKVIIPASISEIPDTCFFACTSLKEVQLPKSITSIGQSAFQHCAIESIVIQEGVTEIKDSAFSGCSKLKKLKLPSTLQFIGSHAFAHCKYLPIDSLNLQNIKKVDDTAFLGCCRKGYRKAKYSVECLDNHYSIKDEINVELKDDQTVGIDDVVPIIQDQFGDEVWQALEPFSLEQHGKYNINKIADNLYALAKEYFEKKTAGININIKEIDTDKPQTVIYIPLASVFQSIIDERSTCEQMDCDVGGIIESSLLKFVEEGVWRVGLKCGDEIITKPTWWPEPIIDNDTIIWKKNDCIYKPILWFGISETPVEPWTIHECMSEKEYSFWEETDEWYIMEYIIDDCYDGFLTWFFPECGRSGPDMDKIKETCPIDLNSIREPGYLKKTLSAIALKKKDP